MFKILASTEDPFSAEAGQQHLIQHYDLKIHDLKVFQQQHGKFSSD